MTFHIVHTTQYRYSGWVTLCHNEAHLRPRTDDRQRCSVHRLVVEPAPSLTQERSDYFGNVLVYFAVEEPHNELRVTATSTVEVRTGAKQADLGASIVWESVGQRLRDDLRTDLIEARQFVLDSPLVVTSAALAAYAQPSFAPGRPLLDAVDDLNRRIHREFAYERDFTTVSTPLAELLELRRGVCQDFAHLAIGCLRSLGLPARYVSGYVESLPPPGQARLRGADASHAWFSVCDPDQGWVDFDPTNDQLVSAQHVTTAWGRDYSDVSPLKGVVFGGGAHSLAVSVEIARVA